MTLPLRSPTSTARARRAIRVLCLLATAYICAHDSDCSSTSSGGSSTCFVYTAAAAEITPPSVDPRAGAHVNAEIGAGAELRMPTYAGRAGEMPPWPLDRSSASPRDALAHASFSPSSAAVFVPAPASPSLGFRAAPTPFTIAPLSPPFSPPRSSPYWPPPAWPPVGPTAPSPWTSAPSFPDHVREEVPHDSSSSSAAAWRAGFAQAAMALLYPTLNADSPISGNMAAERGHMRGRADDRFPAPDDYDDGALGCCHAFGFGAFMRPCCDSFTASTRTDCGPRPRGFVGGARRWYPMSCARLRDWLDSAHGDLDRYRDRAA